MTDLMGRFCGNEHSFAGVLVIYVGLDLIVVPKTAEQRRVHIDGMGSPGPWNTSSTKNLLRMGILPAGISDKSQNQVYHPAEALPRA
jgi:hypothetical protein